MVNKLRKLLCLTLLILLLVSCQTTDKQSAFIADAINAANASSSEEAITIYQEALEIYETKELRYNYLASLVMNKEYEKALTEIDQAIELYPEILRFYELKVTIYGILEDKEAQLLALEAILEKDPCNNKASLSKLELLEGQDKKDYALVLLDLGVNTNQAKAALQDQNS